MRGEGWAEPGPVVGKDPESEAKLGKGSFGSQGKKVFWGAEEDQLWKRWFDYQS